MVEHLTSKVSLFCPVKCFEPELKVPQNYKKLNTQDFYEILTSFMTILMFTSRAPMNISK